LGDDNKISNEKFIEEAKEEIYEYAINLIEELVSEAIEGLKSEIDEILRLLFNPNTDFAQLDQFSKNQISALKDVFNLFKKSIKEEVLSEIRKELPKKITKVKLAKPTKTIRKKRKIRKQK